MPFGSLPRTVTRPLSLIALLAWVLQMGVLVDHAYLRGSRATLAADLARYGSAAQWRGVYYRGEKIGFTVSQIVPSADGYELQEDGRLQMSLMGATTAVQIRTTAHVDAAFAVQDFEFSLDPGTGKIDIRGQVSGPAHRHLSLTISTPTGTRTDERDLADTPVLNLNLARRLARSGLKAGARYRITVFDPATLSNAPMTIDVGARELVRIPDHPVPAFKVEMEFTGLRTTSWITDTGEVVREESPMGFITERESPERAQGLAVSREARTDLLTAAAVIPVTKRRIDEPRDVRRMRLRVDGVSLSGPDLEGAGQTVSDNIIELKDPQLLRAGAADPDVARHLQPEALIESDAPEIRAEAERAIAGVAGSRARAERLTRHVNAMLEKKPTVSLPSAREVLRTRIGDCNEHTALYVAMARAVGIPARIAVGLVYLHGAFYYHAWPEVYLVEADDRRGLWLPVDPTLNEFPADATHVRLARGGLDRQAVILPMIGRLRLTILDLELAPNSTQILVGRTAKDTSPLSIPLPRRQPDGCCDTARGCWSSPPRPR